MTQELIQQKLLASALEKQYEKLGINARVYSCNEFKRLDAHWAKKPDLIIIGVPAVVHKRLKKGIFIESPIGIEYKTAGQGITKYIRAVKLQAQDRYLEGSYLIKSTNQVIKINTISFTNEEFIKFGEFCDIEKELISLSVLDSHKLWAERVCWAFDMPLLIKRKGVFVWSYRNYYYTLNGKEVGRYGEDGKFIEY